MLLFADVQLVFANASAPGTHWGWPWHYYDLWLGIWMALPASVLAAFLEKPLVAQAGVRKHALWYSLQANFISLMVGYLLFPCSFLWPLSLVFLVLVSILLEIWYYERRRLHGHVPLKRRWIVWGNIFSALVLTMVGPAVLLIYPSVPRLGWEIVPYVNVLTWGRALAGVLMFAASFFVPGILRRVRATPEPVLQPSAVGIPDSKYF